MKHPIMFVGGFRVELVQIDCNILEVVIWRGIYELARIHVPSGSIVPISVIRKRGEDETASRRMRAQMN